MSEVLVKLFCEVLESAVEVLLGFARSLQAVVGEAQVFQCGARLRLVEPQGLRADGQGALQQRFGFGELALSQVNLCQAIQRRGDAGMLSPQTLGPDIQGTLEPLLRL